MTKMEFLEILTAELKHKNVADAADITLEYEQHFAFKLADGYSEEEIAAKLGNPKDIAAQYDSGTKECADGKKIITRIGLCVADFFFGILFILLSAWEIVMGAVTIALGTLAVCLIGELGKFPIFSIPEMPYHCAIILGIAFAALTVLTAVGTIYFFAFIKQLMRSFGRYRKNAIAAAEGKATLPSLPSHPQFAGKTKRVFRNVSMIAIIVFAVCFIAGFVISVITAGSIEFWHTWGWFGYAK